MSRFPFNLPDIGEGITEAEIVEWHVGIGDRVGEGQVIAAVMTDKATVEMEAPVSGTIVELGGEVGSRLPIGALLVAIETDEEARSAPAKEPPARDQGVEETERREEMAERASGSGEHAAAPRTPPGHAQASPAVRQRARDLEIDLAQVPSADGRVRHADLDRYILNRGHREAGAPAGQAGEVRIPVTGLRRQIARRMTDAKRHIPHFTYVEEIDVTELERLRAALNRESGAAAPLHLLPFLLTAICRALGQHPMLNAHFDDEAGVVTRFGAVHAGIATQTDAGLLVPVLRDAQDMDIHVLASAIGDLAMRARGGTLRRDELSGSTITVSSLGKLGGIASTPIVNRPEVAIIAPNRIVERPIWNGSAAVPARLMNLSISCDHRVVDGHDAASFVHAVKRMLETPGLLFV